MSHPISSAIPVSAQSVKMMQQLVGAQIMMAVESQEDFEQYAETSPFVIYQRFLPMQTLKNSSKKFEEKQALEETKVLQTQEVEEVATRFQQKNEEMLARTLLILRSSITEKDTAEEILNKVLRIYADHFLADEALDFLIETTRGRLQETIKAAKELLNKTFAREVVSGRNIGAQAREFSKEGLGSPTSLRDLYRDITGNPREPLQLFDELTDKFRYDKMKTVITFLLHAFGADLKAKGSSIPRAELKRLLDETRSLQGILGIFRFFQSRMRLILREFASYNLPYPEQVTFEKLAKIFVKILAERFVNAEKILGFAKLLGISETLVAQMILFTQYRDALRQIAPRYYRNQQHQAELLKGFIEALEELEDELDEKEEEGK
ncbi:MAG TPA: HrpJ domain-containing protein [Chlamydiales bacterium]|jgi:type III secretion protein W